MSPKNFKQKSQMLHKFSEVPMADISRSAFNRSHSYKSTFDAGYLIPFFIDEALPGDTFRLNATIFARFNTPEVPFMDNLHLDTFYFAVPIRLVWDNFQKFMGEQVDPGDSIDYTVPTVTAHSSTGWPVHSLGDYFGIPTAINSLVTNVLPFRCYNLIWNEWFRDQNLQDSVTVQKGDGPDSNNLYSLLRRGKRHDYFTSCLPWPQKGDASTMNLGTSAPVITNGEIPTFSDASGSQFTNEGLRAANGGPELYLTGGNISSDTDAEFGDESGLQADLTNATAATINQLRESIATQRFLEKDARAGTRYTEIKIGRASCRERV